MQDTSGRGREDAGWLRRQALQIYFFYQGKGVNLVG